MDQSAALPPRHLSVEHLCIDRGGEPIVADLNFSLSSGEVVLLRGPNGAGKSTLLLCLAGILHKTFGTIDWQGRHEDDRPGADIHLIGHRPALKSGLTLTQNLRFWADMCGAQNADVADALAKAGLAHAAEFDAGYLSAGQTRRLSLARLIVAPRPIWLLDEPTSALDAEGDKWVCGLIDNHIAQGGMVIAATHLDLNLKAKPKTLTLGATQ